MRIPRFINIWKGWEVRIFSESIYEVLECYGNFVLRIEFENKQVVFPCKNAHTHKKKTSKKCLLPLGLTFRPLPPGPGSKLAHLHLGRGSSEEGTSSWQRKKSATFVGKNIPYARVPTAQPPPYCLRLQCSLKGDNIQSSPQVSSWPCVGFWHPTFWPTLSKKTLQLLPEEFPFWNWRYFYVLYFLVTF